VIPEPSWVPSTLSPRLALMAGMHCASCSELFEYNEQLIALRREDGELVAAYTIEQEGGAIGDVPAHWEVPRPMLRRDARAAAGRVA
jgi:hypothetical protein